MLSQVPCILQVKHRSRQVLHRKSSVSGHGSDDGSSHSDNVLQDYLSNLQGDSDNSDSYEQQVPMHDMLLCSK